MCIGDGQKNCLHTLLLIVLTFSTQSDIAVHFFEQVSTPVNFEAFSWTVMIYPAKFFLHFNLKRCNVHLLHYVLC